MPRQFILPMSDFAGFSRARIFLFSQQNNFEFRMSKATDKYTLISSVHGRDRRELRSIGKKDLQAAVKYGTKESGRTVNGEFRWKYTFANVVYITDSTSTREITSYILPISIQRVLETDQDMKGQNQLRKRLKNSELCTSHTVLVIDQSGSMRTCDVDNFKTRSDAVYGAVALDIVGNMIDTNQARGTDVLTLIEMKNEANVIYEREPITNILFNMLLERLETNQPSSHGNFYPALQKVRQVLENDQENEAIAVMMIFLSDGNPSDHHYFSMTREDSSERILKQVELLSQTFTTQLTVGTIGFGQSSSEFLILNEMARTAEAFGAFGSFKYSKCCPVTLSSAMTSMSSQLTMTRMRLESHAKVTERDVILEKLPLADFFGFNVNKWTIYNQSVYRCRWKAESQEWDYEFPMISAHANGIAKSKKIFGKGAERMVFVLQELHDGQPVGERLAGKETKYAKNEQMKMKYHEVFCKTQHRSGEVAREFNARVESLLKAHGMSGSYAQIKFLDCFVYCMLDTNVGFEFQRGILAEKLLDPEQYMKWNDNTGRVHEKGKLLNEEKMDADSAPDVFEISHQLDLILEESEDEPDEEDMVACFAPGVPLKKTIEQEDFPQAFSHFSYQSSKRQILVCDLQGVLNTKIAPHVFELTDPVIHSASDKKGAFGRTDRGKKGMQSFFKTHHCNALCELLGLPNDK